MAEKCGNEFFVLLCLTYFTMFYLACFPFVLFVFLLLLRLTANKVVYIMYVLVASYTLIMFLKLKVLTHLIFKIKKFIKCLKKGVTEYFNIFMKFLYI